jgi:acetylornithine deacetylase/succinyl-diaminopimelate desuccinylase-like protein
MSTARGALRAAWPVGLLACATALAGSADSDSNALARTILQQLVQINTTDTPAGNVTTAAQAMQRRFSAAGFQGADLTLLGPSERKQNLVVRLHGTGAKKPVLLIGHLDVVEAKREDWSTDPFQLVEKDGWFYGRGSLDMKSPDAIMVATLLRLKQEGFRPARDIILALTADEEGGTANGVQWLLAHHRELVDAQFVINGDDYSVILEDGKPKFFQVVGTEKLYADYQLTVLGPGGHSSQPVHNNPIYSLARGLERLAAYEFPFELNTVTRSYYERLAPLETGQRAADMRGLLRAPPDAAALRRLAADPVEASRTRTTCVATRLAGGHANNALPQRAEAVVNCRILPGHPPEEVRQELQRILADPAISVRYLLPDGTAVDHAPPQRAIAPPPLAPEVIEPLERVVGAMWPGIKVVPTMSPGASDAVFTAQAGIPTYTFSGLALDPEDDREHGRDERVGVESFYRGNEFMYRYLKALTGP